MPEISVITACHPAKQQFLGELYASLVAQEGVAWQWCLVLDGDAPLSLDVGGDPRVKLSVHPSSQGASAARNTAALLADAPIMRNVDADDYLYSCNTDISKPKARVGFGF